MDNPLFLPAGNWPVAGTYDVAVIGAGPGGLGAAVAAARAGARTVLIEKDGYAGGISTAALVPNIMGLAHGGRQIVGGIADELCRRLGRMGYAYPRSDHRLPAAAPLGDGPIPSDLIASAHGIRLCALRMLEEAGATPLFHTRFLGAVREGDRLAAIAVDMAEGPALLRAATFVDATGDAHLIHRAGGRVRVASEDERMTKTMLMDFGGIDRFDPQAVQDAFMAQVEAKTVPVAIQDRFMGYASFDRGIVHLNFTATTGDALSSAELTRMDHELREQIEAALPWFRRFIPGFEKCFLARSPHRVGVRAGRGAVGLETITQADIDADAPVPEPVGVGLRRYGDHGIKGFSAAWAAPVNGIRAIPWRTLLSADFGNVALAGRAISCEPKMLTCIRYIAQCVATGQAAGITAALAAKAESSLAEVGYPAVRDTLRAGNAILHP